MNKYKYLSFEDFDICIELLNILITKMSTLPNIANESSQTSKLIYTINEVLYNEIIIYNRIDLLLENILLSYGWNITTKQFNSYVNTLWIICLLFK